MSDRQSAHLMTECHKIASAKGRGIKIWMQLVPSVAIAVSGLVVAVGGPTWFGAIAALSGVLKGAIAVSSLNKIRKL